MRYYKMIFHYEYKGLKTINGLMDYETIKVFSNIYAENH
jgi:hypothetical protein